MNKKRKYRCLKRLPFFIHEFAHVFPPIFPLSLHFFLPRKMTFLHTLSKQAAPNIGKVKEQSIMVKGITKAEPRPRARQQRSARSRYRRRSCAAVRARGYGTASRRRSVPRLRDGKPGFERRRFSTAMNKPC